MRNLDSTRAELVKTTTEPGQTQKLVSTRGKIPLPKDEPGQG